MMRFRILLLFVSLCVTNAEENHNRVVSCFANDGDTTVFLKRSDKDNKERSLWIEKNGVKEEIWANERREGYSIATNRGVWHKRNNLIKQKRLESGYYDSFHSSVREKNKKLAIDSIKWFEGRYPDPYKSMELAKAAVDEYVIVILVRNKIVKSRQDPVVEAYAGGFFYDQGQTSPTSNVLIFAPHSNYSWMRGMLSLNDYSDFKAPWAKEHDGYEYFLRSYLKGSDGRWKVHVSAALSILWADSLGLPITKLEIEDKDTYAVTFKGKYNYYKIDAEQEIYNLCRSEKEISSNQYNITLFDPYGGVEKLIYRGDTIEGETIERIKYIAPEPIKNPYEQIGLVLPSNPANTKDLKLSSVYTSLHGSSDFYRLAFDRDPWRGLNSWVGYDELSEDQVYTRPHPKGVDGIMPYWPVKLSFGFLSSGYRLLKKGEIRQSYTMKINDAKKELERRITASGKPSNDGVNKRNKIYLDLINSAIGESKK